MKKKLEVIFEDDHLIVVNKTAPLLSIPDRFNAEKTNLYHLLQKQYGEIFIVHRLDKETSGVICFAKTTQAHQHLSKQFEARTTQKYYHAIVQGAVMQDRSEINSSIAHHPSIAGKMTIHKKGKPSLSLFEVKERFKHHTLVEVDLKTGRTHQIRVHLASIGHPLLVDSIYAAKNAFYVSNIKNKSYQRKKDEIERPLISRLTLHAHQLILRHPISEEEIEFTAESPKDFRATLQQLRKWAK